MENARIFIDYMRKRNGRGDFVVSPISPMSGTIYKIVKSIETTGWYLAISLSTG